MSKLHDSKVKNCLQSELSFYMTHFLSTKATAVHVINGNYMTFELTSNKLNGLLVSSRCGTASLVILLTCSCYMLRGIRVVELIYRWGQRGKLKNYDTGVVSRARSVSQRRHISILPLSRKKSSRQSPNF